MNNIIKILKNKGFEEIHTNKYYINISDIDIYCNIDYSVYEFITFIACKKIENTIVNSRYKTLIERFLVADDFMQNIMIDKILNEIIYSIHEQIKKV
ncbi:MAG: hypothetical protein RSF67_00425 [Clostridia bacterium]